MTVGQLIEELKKEDPNKTIRIWDIGAHLCVREILGISQDWNDEESLLIADNSWSSFKVGDIVKAIDNYYRYPSKRNKWIGEIIAIDRPRGIYTVKTIHTKCKHDKGEYFINCYHFVSCIEDEHHKEE